MIEVAGVSYLSAADVARRVGVSRTTLWRWRHDGKIPQGHRYRDRQVLFTVDEFEVVRAFADKVEPLDSVERAQLTLFKKRS